MKSDELFSEVKFLSEVQSLLNHVSIKKVKQEEEKWSTVTRPTMTGSAYLVVTAQIRKRFLQTKLIALNNVMMTDGLIQKHGYILNQRTI